MYSDKSIPVSEILETYHISRTVLSRILKEEAVPFRLPKAAGKRANVKLDRRPICHKSLMAKDARFCCWVVGVDPMLEAKAISLLINSLSFGHIFIHALIMTQRRKQKKYLMT